MGTIKQGDQLAYLKKVAKEVDHLGAVSRYARGVVRAQLLFDEISEALSVRTHSADFTIQAKESDPQ